MSRTQFKNAAKIWEAFQKLSSPAGKSQHYRNWRTVGEVAIAAGMSKPTVRKYLKMAVEQGVCLISQGQHCVFYCPAPAGEEN